MEEIIEKNEARYDRQIRLWKASGQEALANSRILSLGVSAISSEALKNMILSGIKSFSILDDKICTQADLNNNFFMEYEEGVPRGAINVRVLNELNPSVEGYFINEDPFTVTDKSMDFFLGYDCIILPMSLTLNDAFVVKLCEHIKHLNLPVAVIDAAGYVGYFRLVYTEQPVIETHPDSIDDLRLSAPETIQGLLQWIQCPEVIGESPDFVEDSEIHGNIPYLALLVHYIQKWAKLRDDGKNFPTTYQERKELAKLVSKGMKVVNQENFEEAINSINSKVKLVEVPKSILELFEDAKATQITAETDNFWILIAALHRFYLNEGQSQYLPLSGSIPDMKADSKRYIQLQVIYHNQARLDREAVKNHLINILQENSIQGRLDSFDDETITTLCKQAYHLQLTRPQLSLQDEWDNSNFTDSKNIELDFTPLQQDSEHPLWYYLVLRARQRTITIANKLPGSSKDPLSLEKDLQLVLQQYNNLLTHHHIQPETTMPDGIKAFLNDLVSFAHLGELVTTAAVIGGAVAQELTKLITKQYVPLNSTMVFDGIKTKIMQFDVGLKN